MQVLNKINLDMVKKSNPPIVYAMQNDTNSRVVEISLFSNSAPWIVPPYSHVSVAFKNKTDKHKGWYDKLPDRSDACTVSGNVVTAILAPAVLSSPGEVDTIIVFQDENLNQLATFGFSVIVESNPTADISISNDYYAYSNMEAISAAVDAIMKECAPAIVCNASGSGFAVSDSADRPLQSLRIFGKTVQQTTTGKNLCDATQIVNGPNNTSVSVSEDGYTIVSVGGSKAWSNAVITIDTTNLKGKTVYLKADSVSITQSYSAGVFPILFNQSGTSHPASLTINAHRRSFEIPEDNIRLELRVCANYTDNTNDADMTITVKGLVLSVDDYADWEPYTGSKPSPSPDYPQELRSVGDGGSVGLTLAGKNLLPFPYSSGGMSSNFGIAITCNADGGITFVGTATGAMYYWLKKDFTEATLPAGNYYLSATGLSNMSIQIETIKNGAYVKTIRVGAGAFTVDYSTYDTLRVFLVCNSGKTVNETIYPQIELGKAATTYEPYKAQTFAVSTPNGLPGIPVASGGNYTDEHGQMWLCDEIDLARGVYVQRVITKILKGNGLSTSGWIRFSNVDDCADANTYGDAILCTHYVPNAVTSLSKAPECSIRYAAAGGELYAKHTAIATDDETANAYFEENEVGCTYILAEPIETVLDAAALHTRKPTTTVLNDAGAHMELSYVADTKAYIDNKFAELAAAYVNN